MKSLKEISWEVTEEAYRADSAFSYSTLSEYYRSGAKSLLSKEKKDTDALRFGSLVDCLITEPETLIDRFYVADNAIPSDGVKAVVDSVFFSDGEVIDKIDEISDSDLLLHLDSNSYQSNWKFETRKSKIIKEGSKYFELLKNSKDKTLISVNDYTNALECVDTLKNHRFTKKWFDEDPFDNNVEHLYQLKFKTEYNGIPIRGMMDKTIVNHSEKWIQPIDLKTTGKDEVDFEKSFVQWNYWLQSCMYSEILRKIIYEDEYFKDFEILPFKFIVINRRNLSPCCWTIPSVAETNVWALDNMGESWSTFLHKANYHRIADDYKYNSRVVSNDGDCVINLDKLK